MQLSVRKAGHPPVYILLSSVNVWEFVFSAALKHLPQPHTLSSSWADTSDPPLIRTFSFKYNSAIEKSHKRDRLLALPPMTTTTHIFIFPPTQQRLTVNGKAGDADFKLRRCGNPKTKLQYQTTWKRRRWTEITARMVGGFIHNVWRDIYHRLCKGLQFRLKQMMRSNTFPNFLTRNEENMFIVFLCSKKERQNLHWV